MAKKKAAAPRKVTPKRQPKARARSKAAGAPAKRTRKRSVHDDAPKSQTLPGMAAVRNARLDNICEAVSGYRGKRNAILADEKSDLSAALTIMREKKMHSYRHAGVELARVSGEEKLRVRTTDSEATAAVMDEEDEPGEETVQPEGDGYEDPDAIDGEPIDPE